MKAKIEKIILKLYSVFFQKPCLPILKRRGMVFGKNFNVQKGCILDDSHCFLISFGDNVTIAPNVHILAHDASTKIFTNYTKIGKVVVGNNVFIGANTVILPGVTIEDNIIIGAGSVVTKSLSENYIYAGNPAKKIMTLDEYLKKYDTNLLKCFDESYRIGKLDRQKRNEMIEKIEADTIVFLQ